MRRWARILRAPAACVLAGAALTGCGASPDSPPRPDVSVRIAGRLAAPPVPAGFIGVSMEYQSAAVVAGPSADPNRAVQRLIAGLAPGQSPVIRIGGDSTDRAWWPAPGLRNPDRTAFALTRSWIASIRTLARAVHARLMLGINLEAGSAQLAGAEAQALVRGIGQTSVQALEVGNEPNLYASLPWYRTAAGAKVFGRPGGYTPAQYLADLARIVPALPVLPLAGPALGAPHWMSLVLDPLLAAQPRITEVTFHRYPLNRCFTKPSEPTYPTIPHLLAPSSSRGLAASVAGFARTAHRHGAVFRVDELNSVACSGQAGISDTYASALWALDALFAMAGQGVSGVNIHTLPSAAYRLFTVRRSAGSWSAAVAPEYYGLLMFTQAAPPGSRLLAVKASGPATVRAWATSVSGGPTRVVLINDSARTAHVVQLSGVGARGTATVERLRGPGLSAKRGVTLDGRAFPAWTTTGELPGSPRRTRVPPDRSGFAVRLPAASAALVTITSR